MLKREHQKIRSLIVLVLLGFSALSIPLAFFPSTHAYDPALTYVKSEFASYSVGIMKSTPSPNQRNAFTDSFGKTWAFAVNSTGSNPTTYRLYYKTTTDKGLTWSSVYDLGVVANGSCWYGGFALVIGYAPTFSIWWDGTHLAVAYSVNNAVAYGTSPSYPYYTLYYNNFTLYYRLGTPNTITNAISWTTGWQNVFNGTTTRGSSCDELAVALDSNGYPWIGYQNITGSHSYDNPLTYILKSSTNDGTWVNAVGFPYMLTVHASRTCIPIPLTGGKMAIVWEDGLGIYAGYYDYNQSHLTMKIKSWDGASWRSTVSYNETAPYGVSPVAIGDIVHISFESVPYDSEGYATSDGLASYINYTYSTNTISNEQRLGTTYGSGDISISKDSAENLFIYWITYGGVGGYPPAQAYAIMKNTTGGWSDNQTLFTSTEHAMNNIFTSIYSTDLQGFMYDGDSIVYFVSVTYAPITHSYYMPSAAPLEIYYNYTNFMYTEGYVSWNGSMRNDLWHRITVLNNTGLGLIRGDVKVLTNVILNVTALSTTTNAEIYLGLRSSPNGSLLNKWNLAFNTTAYQNYILNITLPKPIISDQVILELNTTVFNISEGPYTTRYPVYDYNGVDQGWSATVIAQYFDFEPLVYHKYAHSHFTVWSDSPYLTTDDQLSFKYLDKPPSMFYVLNVTGYLPFNVTSNYIVYSPDTTHHYIPLPFNYFYNVGQAFLTLSGNTTYAVTPYDENTFKPISANAWLRVDNMNETRYLIYQTTNTTGLTYVYGNLGGAHRTLPWAKIAKIYFPYNETFYAYTFTVDFGHTYRLYDMFGTLLDLGNVSSPTKAFTTSLQYGKTYRLIIDGTHTFDIGADANTMRMLYNYVFPVYDRGDIVFEATRTLTWATVHFRDTSRNGSVTLTTYSSQGGTMHLLSTVTLPSGTFDWSFDVDPNQAYIVKAQYVAVGYGSYDATIPISETSVNDLSGLMGNMTIGGTTVSISSFLFTTVMFGVFALFSHDNAELGIIIGVLLSFFLSWFNLISWGSSIANLCYGLLLVAVFELMSKKETGA